VKPVEKIFGMPNPKGVECKNVNSPRWNLGKTYQKCLNPEGVECE